MTIVKALLWGLALSGPALANDSVAGMGVGGLELHRSDAIAMLSEELHITPDLIRVRYVFRNESDAPVHSLVAFPLPERGVLNDFDFVNLPDPESDNYVRFETLIDGKPAALRVEHRAILDGVNRAADLAALGVSPVPFAPWIWDDTLRALPEATRAALRAGGFLDDEGQPRWTLQSTFYREQVFAPGRDVVVEHRYVPVAAGAVDSLFPGPEAPDRIEDEWLRDHLAAQTARYCVSDADKAAMRAQLAGETGLAAGSTFWSAQVDYILSTGANWRGPIRDFHLVVESPGRWDFAFLCLEGVERVGPSRLEFHASDFTPPHDLSAYFAIAAGEAIPGRP